jgi:membrane protein YqaA with SNARE-associated domain
MSLLASSKAKLRKRLRALTQSYHALPIAGLIGFLENTIIIVAMEPLFLPMMASRGRGAWKVALALLIGNVLGGLAMYTLGMWLEGPVIEPLVASMGAGETYADAQQQLRENGFMSLFLIGITPFPFQIGAAAAGVVGYGLVWFLLAVTVSRAIRYGWMAAVIMVFGHRAENWIEKHELEIFLLGIGVFAGFVLYAVFMA